MVSHMNDEQRRMAVFWAQPEGTRSIFPQSCVVVGLCRLATLRHRRLVLRKNGLRRDDLISVNRP